MNADFGNVYKQLGSIKEQEREEELMMMAPQQEMMAMAP